MVSTQAQTRHDRIWKAMADPARRRILDLLRERPLRTGELAEDLARGFSVSRFMVMKHLKSLVEAGLVLIVRRGRERWNHLNAVPIQEIHRRWIEPFAKGAADSMLRLKNLAESVTPQPGEKTPMSDSEKPEQFEVHEVVVEVQVQAPREKVWNTLTGDVSAWWPKDYCTHPEGSVFHIQPKVGGYMFEESGDGDGTIWGTVTHVKRLESLRLSAELWPEYGGPARSIQRFVLTEDESGTKLRFTDTLYGSVNAEGAKSMEKGWSYLFGTAFKEYAEEGKRPPDVSPSSC